SVLAFKNRSCRPSERAAACASVIADWETVSVGGWSMAKRVAPGTSSCSNCRRFPDSSIFIELIPVTLPPGRLKLATRPIWTGSAADTKTIGIVAVAALAASGPGVPPVAMIATRRRTRSAANAGKRLSWPSAQRYSTATFWPSTNPSCLRPSRNASSMSAKPSGDWAFRNPTTGIPPGCCALAASGHAVAAPPRRVRNSRRCIAGLLFDDLVGAHDHEVRHGEAKRLRGLKVEDRLVLDGRL